MEDTLCRMQDLVLADTQRLIQISKRIVEIADVRLIGADVLRGDDPVELDAEVLVALGEGRSVDVRDDDELVEPLQILQPRGPVVERRPTRDRLTEVHNLVHCRSDAPPPRQS